MRNLLWFLVAMALGALMCALAILGDPAVAQDNPFQSETDTLIIKLSSRIDELETEALQQDELLTALSVMLSVNFTGDCALENNVRTMDGVPKVSQTECVNSRIDMYDEVLNNSTEDVPSRPTS